MAEILKSHIQTVMGHYRQNFPGVVTDWDVVNEAVFAKQMRPTPWSAMDADPVKYVEMAFRWAREADPNAKLFYNDNGTEKHGGKFDQMMKLLKELKSRKIPIDGVGFQMHLGLDSQALKDFPDIIKKTAALDLDIHITEMEVSIPKKSAESPSALAKKQAEAYVKIASACLSTPRCKVFTVWGVADPYSWIMDYTKGTQWNPLLLDDNFKPKPAYDAIRDFLLK